MAHLLLLVFLAVASFPGLCLGGAQPPQGKCCHYKFGGRSRLHLYVCCNNCDENNGNPTCDRVTYDGASDHEYCGHCGVDLGDGKVKGDPFDCGGCEGQTAVKKVCDKKYGWVFAGLCWIWSYCFERRCERLVALGAAGQQGLQNGSLDLGYFCGDGVCDESSENRYNCPFDCCPVYNKDQCSHKCNKCLPPCCGESSCCL